MVPAAILLLIASTGLAEPTSYVLRNAFLEVTVDLKTGRIQQFLDLATPDAPLIFGANDVVLDPVAGNYRPAGFSATSSDSTSVTLVASAFQYKTASIPLKLTVRYRLTGCRVDVDYHYEALGLVNLDTGLDINTSSSVWDTMYVRNQYSGEDPFIFGQSAGNRYLALNQVYELHNSLRNLSLVFPNPYHSLVTVTSGTTHSFRFSWRVLVSVWPFEAVDPRGPQIASVLAPGVEFHRQIQLVVGHDDDALTDAASPIAYFSPFPNGYDQVIAMTFDDVPFETWAIPKSSHDPSAPVQQYLVRLLEDHPKMKMGWIILPDPIFSAAALENPNYPPGKWWLAHGTHRILTHAPESFLQWLRNIDRDSVVYGYENRVHLGSHAYHHTPEMLFGANYEFQSYDPVVNDSTFAAIVREYALLGLSEKSNKWIRFPGFYFTRATIESLIKYGFVFFDYWGIYDKLPWMQFYSEYGRVWGAGTWWAGDRPDSYEMMDKILRAGKLCHTAGHPDDWFHANADTSYQVIDQIFQQAEANFPNLGYMFPDDVGYFADETCDINTIDSWMVLSTLYFSFVGTASLGQTLVVEWPYVDQLPTSVSVDGQTAPQVECRGQHLVIVLPQLTNGSHVVRVMGIPKGSHAKVPPASLVLLQNFPNPFNPGTVIRYGLPKTVQVELIIYNVRGERVAVLADQRQEAGMYTVRWDGRDSGGRDVASGIYFCRLQAGGLTRVRKLIVVR